MIDLLEHSAREKVSWLPNNACTRSPAKSAGAMVVGVCAFSSSWRGLELVPAKWRCLVPPTSTPAADAGA